MALIMAMLVAMAPANTSAQEFDFQRLEKQLTDYTVILEMKIELSFGMQTTEQEQRLLGTIVTEDGMVIFDGSALSADDAYASLSGMTFKITPTKIEVFMLDGEKLEGEYLGVDRFTQIGVLRITNPDERLFKPVKFKKNTQFRAGDWVGLFMLLPKFVDPSLAADVGMVSALITNPEFFPLTIGFGEMQLTSVLYSEDLKPVGVLGMLVDPSSAAGDQSSLLESFGRFQLPMLGVVTGERLEKLITEPPRKGETDRSWLGITLQALTPDIGEFIDIDVPGGIIVNSILNQSPAEKAGLEVGDVIHKINGLQVEVDREEELGVFQRAISQMAPGTSVELSVLRPTDEGVKSLALFSTLEQAPIAASDAAEYENETLEFKVRNLVFADFHYYNLDEESLKGVVVSELQRGGLSALGGLQIGDIIQSIGTTPVTSVEEARETLEGVDLTSETEVIFFVWRDNKTLFVNVKTD